MIDLNIYIVACVIIFFFVDYVIIRQLRESWKLPAYAILAGGYMAISCTLIVMDIVV